MRYNFLFFLFFIFVPFFSTAQTRSAETIKVDGRIYYMHNIREGETLKGIASAYNVAVIDIKENNPTALATGKIKSGTRLRIPDMSEINKEYPLSQWDIIYYQVKTQVKLKEIAKEYNIDVKDIKKNNPDISNKPAILLKVRIPLKKGSKEALAANEQSRNINKDGKTNDKSSNPALAFNWDNNSNNNSNESGNKQIANIKEPTKKEEERREETAKISCEIIDYNPKEKSFVIGVLLPLLLDETGKKDYNYIAFLEGVNLAIEKLKTEGFSARIIVKDIYDKKTLSKALSDESLKQSNLIIGPFAPSVLKVLSDFSKEYKIPLVSPYDSRTESLAKDNPYFFQIYPAETSIDKELFQKTVGSNSINVVLAHSATPDSAMLKVYQSELKKAFSNYTDYKHKMGLHPYKSRVEFNNILKKDTRNLVFVASNDEPFVSDLLERLKTMNSTQYPISLYGTSQWRRSFKMIDLLNYYTLNMHVVQPFYIDYADDDVKNFIRNYRQTYNNEPIQYAYQGYDIAYYFLSALKNYGTNFSECLHNFEIKLLQSRYKFEQLYGREGGFINTESFLLEYTSGMEIIKH